MKVETKPPVDASQQATGAQASNQEYQAMILLNLLGKAAKDLLDGVEQYKLDIAQEEGADPKKGGKGGAAVGEKHAASTHKSSHSQNAANALLEAYLEELQTNQSLAEISQQTVQMIINYVVSQLEGLQDLQNEIQQLQKELKNNLSPAEIQAITEELNSLEEEYNAALAQYNSAQSDYQKNKQAAQDAQNDYNSAQQQYNQIQDKSSPEAQKLKQEMEADQAKMNSAHSAMSSDQQKMQAASNSIANAESGLSALAAKYPALSTNINALINVMKQYGNASAAFTLLNNQIAAIGREDQQLTSEINSKEAQLQALINVLSHGSDTVQKALEQFLESSKTIDEEAIIQILTNFLFNMVNHQNYNTQVVDQHKDTIARISDLTTATRHQDPVYRHKLEKSTHEIGLGV